MPRLARWITHWIPAPVLLAGLLSLAYLPLRWLLVEKPEDLPLPLPYYLLSHLESDGMLRSAAFDDRAAALRTPAAAWLSFRPAGADPDAVTAADGVAAHLDPRAFQPDDGSLCITTRERPGVGWHLEIEGSFAEPPPSLLLEGRLALDGDPGARPPDLRIVADVHWWPEAPRAPQLRVQALRSPEIAEPAADLQNPDARLVFAAPRSGEWLEFRFALRGPSPGSLPNARQPVRARVQLVLQHPAENLLLDELTLRRGTRLDGLLEGGHAPRTGTTETTRSIKRMVRLGEDERLCLALQGPAQLTYVLVVPPAASLQFGLAALHDGSQRGSSDVAVAVSREGEFEETLLRTTVHTEEARAFRDHRLDLSRFQGDKVRLQFRLEAGRALTSPLVLLADPVLDAPRPEASPPHLIAVFHRDDVAWEEESGLGELLGSGAVRFAGIDWGSDDAELNLLSALSGARSPAGPIPDGTVAELPAEIATLEETLRRAGYQTCVALPAGRGWALSGSTRRLHSEHRVAAVLDFLDQHLPQPIGVLVELGDPAEAELRELHDGLRSLGILERSVLAVLPLGAHAGSTWQPAFLRLPAPDAPTDRAMPPLRDIEIASTLLQALGVEAGGGDRGRTLRLVGAELARRLECTGRSAPEAGR